jgi:hypothetical protein
MLKHLKLPLFIIPFISLMSVTLIWTGSIFMRMNFLLISLYETCRYINRLCGVICQFVFGVCLPAVSWFKYELTNYSTMPIYIPARFIQWNQQEIHAHKYTSCPNQGHWHQWNERNYKQRQFQVSKHKLLS